jgi:aminopeptidase YwaD
LTNRAVRFSRARSAVITALSVLAVTVASAARQASNNPITEASIRGHMEFLASDAMRGRGSGTDDEWRTAVYIASHLRRWGLEPLGDTGGYVQRIETGQRQVAAPPTLTVGTAKLTHGREMIVQSIGAGTASGVIVQWREGLAATPGTFVVIPQGQTPNPQTLSAAAGVITSETPDVRSTWGVAGARLPGSGRGRGRAGGAPQVRLVLASDAFASVAALANGAPVTFDVETKPTYTWNAVGQLIGRDATRAGDVILLSAHLDHLGVRDTGAANADGIFNGADDDASGSTAVLELAQAIAAGPRPARTIIFAWFGSEESGGAGSRSFVDRPPVPLERIIANLQFEMIGRPDASVPPRTLWLTGHERSNLGAELARQGARLVADPHPQESFFTRSDNIRFACRGVVAHTVSSYDAKGEHYHRASDDVSTIDFRHMTEAIQSMLAPVLWLASSTFTPEWLPGKKPAPGNGCR